MESITSRGKYLISAGIDGTIIVYDYGKQEEERSFNVTEMGVTLPTTLLLMENENTIVIGDSKGLHSVNLRDTVMAEKC